MLWCTIGEVSHAKNLDTWNRTLHILGSRKNEPVSKFKIDQYSFWTVKAFTYSNFKVSRNNSTSLTIDDRVQPVNKSYSSLIKLFKSKLPKRQCKLNVQNHYSTSFMSYRHVWYVNHSIKSFEIYNQVTVLILPTSI